MRKLASLPLARPKTVLAVWLALTGLLALVGMGVESDLHRTNLSVPGSKTSEMVEALEPAFGEGFDGMVLLSGPRPAVNRQGRALVRRLARIDGVSLIAPWSGAGRSLRPDARSALIVIRAQGDFDHVSKDVSTRVRRISTATVRPPVSVHVSGYADIAAGIHEGIVEAIEQAELIAIPLLVLILLLVFRSPIAAALPLFVGLVTIGAAKGVLALINTVYPLDALALNIASMMGLALGVDYALLMVSRYREELGAGLSPAEASLQAARRTGHTILVAGLALSVAMIAAVFVAPGELLVGVGLALISAVLLSVLSALTGLPAVLVLLGANVDRWSFGNVRRRPRVGVVAVRALRHPAFAVAFVGLIVLLLSANSLALEMGPPDPRELPPGDERREDYVAVKRALGGGWIAPYEIGITTQEGPLTEPSRLRAINRFEAKLAARHDVAAVLGPGRILDQTRDLSHASERLAGTRRFLDEGLDTQTQLTRGLSRVGSGVSEMRGSLAEAAAASARLGAGGEEGAAAAASLDDALGAAASGAERLESGIAEAEAALAALAQGSRRALGGAGEVEGGVSAAHAGLAETLPQMEELSAELEAEAERIEAAVQPAEATGHGLRQGLAALEAMGEEAKLDPEYERALLAVSEALASFDGTDPRAGGEVREGYEGIEKTLSLAGEESRLAAAAVSTLRDQTRVLEASIGRIEEGVGQLDRGLERLDEGTRNVLAGIRKLGRGEGRLVGGLGALQAGSDELLAGLAQLDSGAGILREGLDEGRSGVDTLGGAISRMLSGALGFRGRTWRLRQQSEQTTKLTPLFRSGYFRLAAVDTAGPNQRRTASFALSLDRGGGGARITVIGYGDPQRAGDPLRDVLEREIRPLSRQAHASVHLGGTASGLQDFDNATSSRLPLVALVLSVVTFVVLVGVLRSLLLPLLAVAFNLLTVAAAFGVTAFFFTGSNPLFGGPGFIDAITAYGIFSIMFGLSIDYEVFLLMRMREGYDRSGSAEEAITYGVERTAGVITGAAAIMTVVFLAFAATDIAAAKQLGVALTVAVVVDATLIRLVLLPATMKLCGRAIWWLPSPPRASRLSLRRGG